MQQQRTLNGLKNHEGQDHHEKDKRHTRGLASKHKNTSYKTQEDNETEQLDRNKAQDNNTKKKPSPV